MNESLIGNAPSAPVRPAPILSRQNRLETLNRLAWILLAAIHAPPALAAFMPGMMGIFSLKLVCLVRTRTMSRSSAATTLSSKRLKKPPTSL